MYSEEVKFGNQENKTKDHQAQAAVLASCDRETDEIEGSQEEDLQRSARL